jgi:hypothetical protein
MAVAAQVGRYHVDIAQSRGKTDEAQPVRLDAVQAQQRPAGAEL